MVSVKAGKAAAAHAVTYRLRAMGAPVFVLVHCHVGLQSLSCVLLLLLVILRIAVWITSSASFDKGLTKAQYHLSQRARWRLLRPRFDRCYGRARHCWRMSCDCTVRGRHSRA
jgi:hypothetical protein